MSNIQELYQKRQTAFIERRATIKQEVDKTLISIANVKDKSLFEDVQVPTATRCEEVLPELWHEPIDDFDQEVYNRQLASFNATMAQLRVIADKHNQGALECLQKLQ